VTIAVNDDQADRIFDALGEPVRRRILELLRDGPTPVGHLADRLPVGRPAVSKHLKVLSGAGLIEHRSAGTRNLYVLAPAGLAVAQQWLVQTWDTALSAFADAVAAESAAVETSTRRRTTSTGRRTSSTRRTS
jgi:predicted ArsR family transcriptional regulator